MYTYRTPGVYFEWLDTRPPAIGLRRTDIAGFVGIATRGPLHQPVKVESWTQFTSTFGGHTPQGYLAHAVEGFFTNDGQTCWVVRVADPTEVARAELALANDQSEEALRLVATSPGVWARNLLATVVRTGPDRFRLTLRLPDGTQEIWRNLRLQPEHLDLLDETGKPTLRLLASTRLTWNLPLIVSLTRPSQNRFKLTLRVSGQMQDPCGPAPDVPSGWLGQVRETWEDLSMDPADARYVEKVLNAPGTGSRLVVVRDLDSDAAFPQNTPDPASAQLDAGVGQLAPELGPGPRFVGTVLNDPENGSQLTRVCELEDGALPTNMSNSTNLRAVSERFHGGQDGLESLRPEHLSGRGAPLGQTWGLATLAEIDAVSIVAMPDIMPKPRIQVRYKKRPPRCEILDGKDEIPAQIEIPLTYPPDFTLAQIVTLQQALVAHCQQLKDRVAILDPRPEDAAAGATIQRVMGWRNQFETSYAALYYPWLMVPDRLDRDVLLRSVPPSGHVAGIYARGDRQVGVHKPPANAVVEGAQDVSAATDDIAHGTLNDHGVNVIRFFHGRGVRVGGARTLTDDPLWRYINVRRLLIMIEEALDEETQWTVFEPNNPELWRQVDRVVRSYLDDLWRRGMLDGATAEEAYLVQCDANTNPPQVTEAGRMVCLIGVQPPWPAEFVVVRIGKTESGTEISEAQEGQNA
jgi:hypothetical protein